MKKFNRISSRRNIRTTALNKIADADASVDTAIDTVAMMSNGQKIKLIKDFIAKTGFENTISLIKNFLKTILSFKEYRSAAVGDQGFMDQPKNLEKHPEIIKPQEPSNTKKSLDKIANVLGFLTLIIFYLAAGTDQFNVNKLHPDTVAEFQSLAAAFGTGIISFLLKYFSHKIK